MSDALHTLVPLFAFMLIPVWIPLFATISGAVFDLIRPQTEHPIAVATARHHEAVRVARATPALQVA